MQSPSRPGSRSVRRSKGIYKRNSVLEGEELPAIALEILSRKCLFPRQPPRDERKEAANIEVRKQFIGDAARRRQAIFLELRKALEQLGGNVGLENFKNALIAVAAKNGAIGGFPVAQVIDDLIQRSRLEFDWVGVWLYRRQTV